MSEYENYAATAQSYDATRRPVGVEIIVGCCAQNKIPLREQHILDAGCGTANYTAAMSRYVARITAIDVNAEMLKHARAKFVGDGYGNDDDDDDDGYGYGNGNSDGGGDDGDGYGNGNGNRNDDALCKINFQQAAITDLPFPAATFDAVMVNQVLHHIEQKPRADFPAHRRAIAEFARVLKPGGALLVNTCSQNQLQNGFWYYHLIPAARDAMRARHAPLDTLREIMQSAGITPVQTIVPVDALMQGDAYFNPRGPLDEHWRAGDSIWSTVDKKTLTEAQTKIKKLTKSNQLKPYQTQKDTNRKHIGQLSFIYGKRES